MNIITAKKPIKESLTLWMSGGTVAYWLAARRPGSNSWGLSVWTVSPPVSVWGFFCIVFLCTQQPTGDQFGCLVCLPGVEWVSSGKTRHRIDGRWARCRSITEQTHTLIYEANPVNLTWYFIGVVRGNRSFCRKPMAHGNDPGSPAYELNPGPSCCSMTDTTTKII